MRQKSHLLHLLLLVFLPLVWSCGTHQTASLPKELNTTLSSNGRLASAHPDTLQAQDDFELSSDSDSQDDDLSPRDLEANAGQEIKDLQKLGAWEDGIAKTPKGRVIESDFPIVINRQVAYYLDFFQNQQHKIFAGWLSRSSRYLPTIKQQLAEAGLPQDLAYLAMIESGFKPNAFSTAKATGLWQFMAPTAVRYGLQVNSYVDERRDAYRSTQAAIRYLSDLYSQFGKWYVAVAAYNAGEGKISCGMQKYSCDTFWDLAEEDYLPLETKRYVPQLIAAIMIAKYPQDYGFTGIQYEYEPEVEVASVPPRTDLAAVAVATNLSADLLYELNRHLSKKQTPPGADAYELKVPKGTARLVVSNLPRVHAMVSTLFKDHVIGRGDTLGKICAKYKVSKINLLKANNLRKAKLVPGNILRIPYQKTQYALLSEKEIKRLAKAKTTPEDVIIHKVKAGDTISGIATRYGTTTSEVLGWNNLSHKSVLRVGQQLTIAPGYDYAPGKQGRPSSAASDRVADSSKDNKSGKGRTIVASRSKIPAKQKDQHTVYKVKSGDTLWTIAQQFDLTPTDLKKWNNLESNQIVPGLTLIIKSKS